MHMDEKNNEVRDDLEDTQLENGGTQPDEVEVSNDETSEGGEDGDSAVEQVHHHHRHHRHSRTRFGHKIRKLKRFVRKNRRVFLVVLVFSLAAVIMLIASVLLAYYDMYAVINKIPPSQPSEGEGTTRLLVYQYSEPIALVHESVLSYIDPDVTASVSAILNSYDRKGIRTDKQVNAALQYTVADLSSRVKVKYFTVYISENPDYSDAQVYRVVDSTTLEVPMLKCGTLYYYKVEAMLTDGNLLSAESYIMTATSPRILTVSGIINVRDIGGWSSIAGNQTIRQELLYRGSELDGCSNKDYTIDKNGIADMMRFLNIKTELDLRTASIRVDGINMLGKNVQQIAVQGPAYDEVFTDDGKEAIRQIFTVLANKDNYPIYMHDTTGCDQTGTVVGILEAFLGVERSQINKEYALTEFSTLSTKQSDFNSFLNNLQKYGGNNSLQGGSRQFLLDCGVTEEQLESLKEIYLTDIPQYNIVYETTAVEQGQ